MKSVFFLFVVFWLNFSVCSAEILKLQATGEYTMSKYETLDFAQQCALIEAEKNAVESVGVYVRSIIQVKNSVVVFDEVISVACNLVKIVQKTFTQNIDSAGNVFVRADIFIEVDSDSVLQGLQRDDLADIVQNYKILQAENISMRNEIEHLKKLVSDGGTDKKILQKTFNVADKQVVAHQLHKEALALEYVKNYDAALKNYNQILVLFPQSLLGHFQRAIFFREIKSYQKSLDDLNFVVANLSDSFSFKKELFLFRGLVKLPLRQDVSAVEDFSQALHFDSNFTYAYVMRSAVYYSQQKYSQAYDDVTKAISLLPSTDKNFLPSMKSLQVLCRAKLSESKN